MSQRKVLGVGIVVAAVAILAAVAYLAMSQTSIMRRFTPVVDCSAESYTPIGYAITVAPGETGYICFPHDAPFRLVVADMGVVGTGTTTPAFTFCLATGYVMASEWGCMVSWVGQNGDGTTTVGSGHMTSGETILTVGGATVRLASSVTCSDASGYPGHNLQIVNGSACLVHATLIY